jgi:hypothetical protein
LENPIKAKFAEYPFHALWGIRQEVSKLQLQVTNVSLGKGASANDDGGDLCEWPL